MNQKSHRFDWQQRVVSLANLEAMCEHITERYSARRWSVDRVTAAFAYVSFSNPDEYGHAHPITMQFPVYWGRSIGKIEPVAHVVLDAIHYMHDPEDIGHDFAFMPLKECPKLWRNPETEEWHAEPDAAKQYVTAKECSKNTP